MQIMHVMYNYPGEARLRDAAHGLLLRRCQLDRMRTYVHLLAIRG
jgi:hypothetical protein